ncbi:MAG: DNA/RNA non-specific endonuclease [Tidjanibacter sp.]|nr:DNA/RNA non-specific endonuclease [Tidjanibacter sp.]
MKTLNAKLFTLLLPLLLWACDPSIDNPQGGSSLKVETDLIEIGAEKSTRFVTITTDLDWTIVANAEWITFSANAGTGNRNVLCSFAANAEVARTAQITVATTTADIEPITITVKQAAGSGTPDPDPGPDPNPDPDPDPNATTYRSTWAELPSEADSDRNGVDDKDATLYYAHHLCAGGEQNAQRNGKARNYSVCYSGKYHCPVWVAAPRHSMYVGSSGRTDAYGRDPEIPSNIQYSSKSTGGGCNKGHMLGSAERTSSAATNRQVFYYTNIAPQLSSTFNTGGGAWNNLEGFVDNLVCADTLYEVVGCYFDRFTDAYGASTQPVTIEYCGRSDVARPTMFYYAVLRTKSGNTKKSVSSCTADELKCVAFVIRHTMEKGHQPQAKDMISISDLEKLTRFTYFSNVPNAPKNTFKASDWGL